MGLAKSKMPEPPIVSPLAGNVVVSSFCCYGADSTYNLIERSKAILPVRIVMITTLINDLQLSKFFISIPLFLKFRV